MIISCTLYSCRSSNPGSSREKSRYRSATYDLKIKSVDDIQYKSAYKYDTDGKKYKKHFRKRRRRKD